MLPTGARFLHVAPRRLLADLGPKRGGLLPGGQVNLQRATDIAINGFRSGAWERITLETSEQFAQWLAAGQTKDAARQATHEARLRKPTPQRDLPRPD